MVPLQSITPSWSADNMRSSSFTDLYGEQGAQQALSPLLLGISNLTVTVGREITDATSPRGALQVSYTNATSVPEVIEAHTGYAVTRIPEVYR